jgi:hypothetical protein
MSSSYSGLPFKMFRSFIRNIFGILSGAGFESCSSLYVQFNVGLNQSYGVATPVINM